ncbi:MAG: translation initiation factor [Ktedonobacteraceae bacterium]
MPDRLVYSTDGGRVSNCPRCGLAYKQCRCDQPSTGSGSESRTGSGGQPAKKGDGIVRIVRDRKHRGGKTVTVITGLPANQNEIAALAQQLKKLCGSGGTVKDGVIEIQGDHCDKVQAKLTEMGYKVKRAGG